MFGIGIGTGIGVGVGIGIDTYVCTRVHTCDWICANVRVDHIHTMRLYIYTSIHMAPHVLARRQTWDSRGCYLEDLQLASKLHSCDYNPTVSVVLVDVAR